MNRRDFFGSLVLGSLAALALASFAYSGPASKSGPIEWTILENGERRIYRFHKGPNYTTLEEAFPYMEEALQSNNNVGNSVVMLESITLQKA